MNQTIKIEQKKLTDKDKLLKVIRDCEALLTQNLEYAVESQVKRIMNLAKVDLIRLEYNETKRVY